MKILESRYLNELSAKVNTRANNNGWWDTPRPLRRTLGLVITEMSEAVEAVRVGRFAPNGCISTARNCMDEGLDVFVSYFGGVVKDTLEDEIADSFIRVLDFIGQEKLFCRDLVPVIISEKDPMDFFVNFVKLVNPRFDNISSDGACDLLDYLVGCAIHFDFDLLGHVSMKLDYNATRGIRHGGKGF